MSLCISFIQKNNAVRLPAVQRETAEIHFYLPVKTTLCRGETRRVCLGVSFDCLSFPPQNGLLLVPNPRFTDAGILMQPDFFAPPGDPMEERAVYVTISSGDDESHTIDKDEFIAIGYLIPFTTATHSEVSVESARVIFMIR